MSNNRLGFISDTHSDFLLRSHTVERTRHLLREIRHNEALKAMRYLIKNTDRVIHGGDLFHRGRVLNVDGFSFANTQASFCDFILQGNHDKLADNRKSVFDLLREVCDKSLFIPPPEVVAIPYQPTQEMFEEAVKEASSAPVALLHCEIEQTKDDSGLINMLTPALKKILLNKFDKIFLGHTHKPSYNEQDRIISIGTHYPLAFADLRASDKWGYWTYDIASKTTKFIPTVTREEIYHYGSQSSGKPFVDIIGVDAPDVPEVVRECYEKGALAVRFTLNGAEGLNEELIPKKAIDVVSAVANLLPTKFQSLLDSELKKEGVKEQ